MKKPRVRKRAKSTTIYEHITEDAYTMAFLKELIMPMYKDRLMQEDACLLSILEEFFNVEQREIFWVKAVEDLSIIGELWREGRTQKSFLKNPMIIPKNSVFLLRYDLSEENTLDIDFLNKNGYETSLTLTKKTWNSIVKKVDILIKIKRAKNGSKYYKKLVKYYKRKLKQDLRATVSISTEECVGFRRGNEPQKSESSSNGSSNTGTLST